MVERKLQALLKEIRACTICDEHLPRGPRPVVRAKSSARILVVGQAPGTKVHETGIPFNDPSGDRLRMWMDVDKDTFYDESRIAIAPMGFCYPGRFERGGDRPPRPECAPAWRDKLHAHLPNIELTLLIGQYAVDWYLRDRKKKTLTETVRNWREYGPQYIPTVHPSFRNTGWLKRNPWFDAEVLPELRHRIHVLL